jgi:hypothetical protein
LDVEWPATAPDPLFFGNEVFDPWSGSPVSSANVDIRAAEGGLTLGSDVTSENGIYAVALRTGGVAPTVYRHVSSDGRLEVDVYDPVPGFESAYTEHLRSAQPDVAYRQYIYDAAGVSVDESASTIHFVVLDCEFDPVSDATVVVPDAEQVVYLDESYQPDPFLNWTTPSGNAVALNVPAGQVDAVVAVGGATFRSWTVRADANGYVISLRMP